MIYFFSLLLFIFVISYYFLKQISPFLMFYRNVTLNIVLLWIRILQLLFLQKIKLHAFY
jgi:hypothetical protein